MKFGAPVKRYYCADPDAIGVCEEDGYFVYLGTDGRPMLYVLAEDYDAALAEIERLDDALASLSREDP